MSIAMVLNRRKLAQALSKMDAISQKLPDEAVIDLAQEVVKRVASRLNAAEIKSVSPSPQDIDRLCEALVARSHIESITVIEAAQQRGVGFEALCQLYLAAASRQLGDWWTDDRVSFYQVTIAAGRIYAILRILREQSSPPLPDIRRSAVFIATPGEDHTLGISIAADMARNRGWDIELMMGQSHDEVVLEMENKEPAIIGLSGSTPRVLPGLVKLIVTLRVVNPGAKIILCGHIATLGVDLEGVVGVDTATPDFDTALAYMESLVTNRPMPKNH